MKETRLVNPFGNRTAIRNRLDFFGRRDEMLEIGELIAQQQPVALWGERRAGKSSILNAISFLRDEIRVPPDCRLVYVNCLYAENTPEKRFFKHLFGQIAAQLNTEPLAPERESQWQAIDQAADQQCRLVVLMDEFDVIVQNRQIDRALFSFLRASSHDITYVISSRESAAGWFVEAEEVGSPFWNLFKLVYVGPLKHDEAIQLIQEPASRCGAPFTDEEVAWIHDRGGHLPIFLQMAAYNVFPRRDAPDDWEPMFRVEAEPHVDYLIDFLADRERHALEGFLRGERLEERVQHTLIRKGILLKDAGATPRPSSPNWSGRSEWLPGPRCSIAMTSWRSSGLIASIPKRAPARWCSAPRSRESRICSTTCIDSATKRKKRSSAGSKSTRWPRKSGPG
jgi:hypothetical protein